MGMLIWSLMTAGCVAFFLGKLALIYVRREQIRPVPLAEESGTRPMVSVIVPARNEEANILRCAESLLKQDYPADRFEVITVDDHSEDSTAEIISALAAEYPQLHPVQARPLPEGWHGKSNACYSGAEQASGEWICFVDADTCSEPQMLRAVIAFAEEKGIDLLSFNPFQEMISAAERLLLPGIFTAIATSMKFHESNDPEKKEAIANGQFMLFRRSAYDAVGGHEAVCHILEEDIEFAKVIKKQGKRLYWAFGDEIMRTRMYTGLKDIWQGFGKNMMTIMNCHTFSGALFSAVKSLLLAWVPPVILIISWMLMRETSGGVYIAAFVVSLSVAAALLAMFFAVVQALGVPFVYVFSMPLGFTMQAFVLLQNYRNKKKRRINWKGRNLP